VLANRDGTVGGVDDIRTAGGSSSRRTVVDGHELKRASVGQNATQWASLRGRLQSAAIGVLAAVATVLAIDQFRERPKPAGHEEPESASVGRGQEPVVRTVVVEGGGLDRIAALERQLRDLQAAKAASAKPAVDLEQQAALVRKRIEETYAKLDRTHDMDTADPGWAPGAQRTLVSGLTHLSEELGFKVGAADCKTTTCRATVTWNDYASARTTGVRLVEELYPGLNCVRRIRLNAPADRGAPYTTRFYLDCVDQRAGTVE
jgi:hypothetical protein